jgi:hypothetical protein
VWITYVGGELAQIACMSSFEIARDHLPVHAFATVKESTSIAAMGRSTMGGSCAYSGGSR